MPVFQMFVFIFCIFLFVMAVQFIYHVAAILFPFILVVVAALIIYRMVRHFTRG